MNRAGQTLNQLILQTRANINRGFAIEERQTVSEVRRFCNVEQADGSVIRSRCDTVAVVDKDVAVAIDLNAEKAKLASLVERQQEQRQRAVIARQQCIAQNST